MATKKKSPSRQSAARGAAASKAPPRSTKTPATRPSTPAPKAAPAPKTAAKKADATDSKAESAAKGAPTPGRKLGRLPTGSLHEQPREPAQADELKRKLTAVLNASQRLKKLKGSVPKHFYEIGEILQSVRDDELHQVKGYSSIEDFAEREAGLSPYVSSTALRIFETFLPATAKRISFDRLSAAIRAIDETADSEAAPKRPPARSTRSPIPPHKL